MKYLWDTDTCVYFLNGNKSIAQKVREVGESNICTTILNITELKFGAYNSVKVEENLKRVERLQENLIVLDGLDDAIGTFFAKNKALLRKKGITVGDFDLLIAGFASINNIKLISNNTKHFQHIPDIEIENWR